MAYIVPPPVPPQVGGLIPPLDDGSILAINTMPSLPISNNGYTSNTNHTPATHMPSPQSCEAPQFKGRKVKKFLYKFELQAKSARLMDTQKCEYIVSYCKDKEAKFI